MKPILIFLTLTVGALAQPPQEGAALELLKKALVEFRSSPLPVITYGGHDTPESVRIRELENQIVALKKRMAIIAEIEQFLRDAELALAPPVKQRVVPALPLPDGVHLMPLPNIETKP